VAGPRVVDHAGEQSPRGYAGAGEPNNGHHLLDTNFVSRRVPRGVGTPPTTSRAARSQPSRSWRWRDSNVEQRTTQTSTSRAQRVILAAEFESQSGTRWYYPALVGTGCPRGTCVRFVSRCR
jgi:hypothetical protein